MFKELFTLSLLLDHLLNKRLFLNPIFIQWINIPGIQLVWIMHESIYRIHAGKIYILVDNNDFLFNFLHKYFIMDYDNIIMSGPWSLHTRKVFLFVCWVIILYELKMVLWLEWTITYKSKGKIEMNSISW